LRRVIGMDIHRTFAEVEDRMSLGTTHGSMELVRMDSPLPFLNTYRTSTAFPNSCIYGSSSGIDLILPSVDHRVAVEIIDELHDALFELVF
jgi:hypothetical protein